MQPFKHHILAGTTAHGDRMFVTIAWDGTNLSLTGVTGPKPNGDACGSCGQNLADLIAPGFAAAEGIDARRLHDTWDNWHLNDMQPGTPAQMAWIRQHPHVPFEYGSRTSALAAAGLNPDPATGETYGSKWWAVEVPADVIEWLRGLPTSDELPTRWQR